MKSPRNQLLLFDESRTFFDRNAIYVLMLFGFLMPVVLMLAKTAVQSHQNKVQDWLPADYTETKDLLEFRKNFAGDQFVVVSWKGCEIGGDPNDSSNQPDDPRIELLAQILSGEPVAAWAERKDSRVELQDEDIGLRDAPEPDVPPIETSGREGSSLSAIYNTTDAQAKANLAALKLLQPDIQNYFTKATTARRTINSMTDGLVGIGYDTAVNRLTGSLIGPDGRTSCLLIFLSDKAIGNFKSVLARPNDGWLQVLQEKGLLFKVMELVGIQPDQVILGGPPVDNVAIDQEGQRTLLRLAGLSAMLGLALAWCSLRSIVLTGMVFLCGIFSAAASLALVAIMGDHTDAIMFSMPPLVYVLAISGAVHMINYYRQACIDYGEEFAAERALRMGWKPAVLCSITTALGLLSLCTSELTPIFKFGIYSAAGVLMMLLSQFLLLPALLKSWPGCVRIPKVTTAQGEVSPSWLENFWHWLGSGIIKHYALVGMACALFIGVTGFGLTKIRASVDLMKLFGPEARILHDYQWLEANLGRLVPMELVLRFDHDWFTSESNDNGGASPKNQRRTSTMLERCRVVMNVQRHIEHEFGKAGHDVIGPTMAAATFMRPLPSEPSSAMALMRRRSFETYLTNHFEELTETGYLKVDRRTGDELWRISVRVAAFEDVDYGAFVSDLRTVVDPLVARTAARLNGNVAAVETTYTGVIPIVYKAQRSLLASLISSTWWSFASITPLLMFVSRGFWAGIVAMLPNILPVVVIFGALGWLGVNIDIGTMMAASIALGVAVDDTIHFLTWFRQELNHSKCRFTAILSAYQHCATPTFQAALINGMGLCVFGFSTFMPTRKFGFLMLAILLAGMVAELILLPALLASPLGRVFKPQATKEDDNPDQQLRVVA